MIYINIINSNFKLQVIDIGSIVSERLAAMRRLKEDPNDVNALNAMQRAQNEVK